MTRMYENVRTWNPFVGCLHECSYCYARRIAKRQKHRCQNCYDFVPHLHPERLTQKFKPGETVFVCSMGDISFASFAELERIFLNISKNEKTTFLLQSKNLMWIYHFERYAELPVNVIIGTTIETNRNTIKYSDAPFPSTRYKKMKDISARKYVTIEPIMDFDHDVMVEWIQEIGPEFVYIGYNNMDSKKQHLEEPSLEKTLRLIKELEKITEVRRKSIRKSWREIEEEK